MNKRIAVLIMAFLAISPYFGDKIYASSCISADKNLNMTFPCVQYQGQKYGFTLNFLPNTNISDGFYWKMDIATLVRPDISSDNCISVADNLQLKVSCAEYSSLKYGFTLNFYSNPKDEANLYWIMDLNTLEQKVFTISSPAFSDKQTIPLQYSCDGSNISPPLSWTDAPSGTKSFVLIMDDPDAVGVVGKVWDHWIVYDIPGSLSSIAENIGASGLSSGMKQGTNSVPSVGYSGPCPPNGTHRYYFRLYALKAASLGLDAGASRTQVEAAMQNLKLGEPAILMGKYPQ